MAVEIILYTDYIDQIAEKCEMYKLKILEEFHYFVAPFIKIKGDPKHIRYFLCDHALFIDSTKVIKTHYKKSQTIN